MAGMNRSCLHPAGADGRNEQGMAVFPELSLEIKIC